MEKYYDVLKNNLLFKGFSKQEFCFILTRLNAHEKAYHKNQVIREPETEATHIGLIASGLVYVSKTDIKGNRVILNELTAGESFGEALSLTGAQNSPVSITASKSSTIVFIPMQNIINPPQECTFCIQILQNLTKLLAHDTMVLQVKNDILSQKTTKEKLLLYFEYASKTAGSPSFKINFSREELADFLSLNSSALSRELSKMRQDQILSFQKNSFTLLHT